MIDPMPHDVSLIATGFGLAMILGLLAIQLKMPPLVGYLLAGVVISPATPDFVGDVGQAGQLAELREQAIPFVVAEQNRELVETLRKEGIPPSAAMRPSPRC